MKKTINIPTSWNELSDYQLKKIASIMYLNQSKLTEVRIFFTLLNIRWWNFLKKKTARIVLRNVSLSELKKHYSFIYENQKRTNFIKSFKAKNKTFYAPGDRINNLTVDEFSHAEDLYLGWMRTQNIEFLHYLTAVLYRVKDKGGKRIFFDKTTLDADVKHISKIDKNIFYAILVTYQGCREHLYSQFPIVFPKSTTKNPKMPNSSGFGKLALHLSGKKFGTHQETISTNIYVFLSEFEEQLKAQPNG
ncbi:hypothetical protein [Tenacibaculum piscium]|uniref:hypothetical protein n=1 Tax=Tenacibaculum piscium TaxID=1458515 RepID=UPI001F188175|nr:hypothetical protein [Tenacibaculum piscium]